MLFPATPSLSSFESCQRVNVCTAQLHAAANTHTPCVPCSPHYSKKHRRGHTLLRPGDIPLPLKSDEEAGLSSSSSSSLEARTGSFTTKAPGSVQTRVCVNRDRSNLTHTLTSKGPHKQQGVGLHTGATTTILPDQVSSDGFTEFQVPGKNNKQSGSTPRQMLPATR